MVRGAALLVRCTVVRELPCPVVIARVFPVAATRDRQAALTTDVLPRARMAIEPAVAGYTSGQLPLVSVIEAVQALWLVQADLIAADTELGLAWARLGRAIGTYEAMIQ